MFKQNSAFRVAFIAGGLTQGGAEKQFVYMVKALHGEGVQVKVYCLTQGDYYEKELIRAGIEPVWIGQHNSPIVRILKLVTEIRKFKPHVLQASHFFTNLYVSLVAPISSAISVGSIRSDPEREVRLNGRWGKWLLQSPSALIANSDTARQKALAMGLRDNKIYVLPNIIDLAEFDDIANTQNVHLPDAVIKVITVARLVPVKRLDRFIKAIALARISRPDIVGVIVGDGPEMRMNRSVAEQAGLLPEGMLFTGLQAHIPAWLEQADIFMLTSETEGFPNVLLEAMAASLPVLSTPAGDAASIVEDGVTGCIIGMDDIEGMARKILAWAENPALRRQLGEAGRRKVAEKYSSDSLAERMMDIYRDMARKQGKAFAPDLLTVSNSPEGVAHR